TMLESSGIYFCHDEHSLNAHTRVFFLLNAMAPLVYKMRTTGEETAESMWNVDKWLTSAQSYEGTCDDEINHPMPDEFAHMRYAPGDYAKLPATPHLPVHLKTGRGDDLNVIVEHEFGEWTPCRPEE
ncbi:hypothetical protein PFISCL1PPCAC_9798, partial [Pristionchus fissidentatus]